MVRMTKPKAAKQASKSKQQCVLAHRSPRSAAAAAAAAAAEAASAPPEIQRAGGFEPGFARISNGMPVSLPVSLPMTEVAIVVPQQVYEETSN